MKFSIFVYPEPMLADTCEISIFEFLGPISFFGPNVTPYPEVSKLFFSKFDWVGNTLRTGLILKVRDVEIIESFFTKILI